MTDPLAPIGDADVLLGLRAADKDALLAALARHAAACTGQDEAILLRLLVARETLGSTGIGRGVAVPHARVPGLRATFRCFVRVARPIDYGAIDDARVDIVFLLLTPPGDDRQHLALLAAAARRLRDPSTIDSLRLAKTPAEAAATLNDLRRDPGPSG